MHTRSGNAMGRTRAAVLLAAAQCIERYGVRRTTMTDVASRSGVAKATLYNHFRTKDDLLAALVEAHVAALAAECTQIAARPAEGASRRGGVGAAPTGADTGAGLAAALAHAAVALSTSAPLRRVAADDPALLAALSMPGDGRAWQAARAAVVTLLDSVGLATDAPAVDVVLRWLTAHLAWPTSPEHAGAQAALLEAALPTRRAITGTASGQD